MLTSRCCCLFLAAASFAAMAEEDDIKIAERPQPTAAEKQAEAVREFRDAYEDKLNRERNTLNDQRYQAALRKFAEVIATETGDQMLQQPKANEDATDKNLWLSKEEKAISQLSFKSARPRDGIVDEHDYDHGRFFICEIGPVRFVFRRSPDDTSTGSGSSHGLRCGGYEAETSSGSHGGVSGSGSTRKVEVFAHLSEGEKTVCLLNETPMLISKNVLKVCGKYFSLNGKKAILFMYDANSIDKLVVLRN
jgi:hypothetical protein